MKILIVNHYDCRNKGDHSVLSAMLKSLEKSFPGSKITVLSHHPLTDSARCNANVLESLILPSPGTYAKLMTFTNIFRCIIWALFARYLGIRINKLIPTTKIKTMMAYAEADVVLARSTDWFNDIYSGTFITAFFEILPAVLLRKKTVIYAQTIGPFSNRVRGKVYKSALKMLLSRIDLLIVREDASKKVLQSIGLSRPYIYVTADPAFSLCSSSEKRADEILDEAFGPNATIRYGNSPLIGINISRIIYRFCFPELSNPSEKYRRFMKLMVEFIDYITMRFNTAVILIPHVFGPESLDDRKVCKDVFMRLKNKERVAVIWNEYSPEELRSVIGKCYLFIGMRMHTIIHALSMRVPTIGIDYSGKVLGVMMMADQEEQVCRTKTLNLNELTTKFEFAFRNRDKIKTTLESRIKILQRRSALNIILLQTLLGRHIKAKL